MNQDKHQPTADISEDPDIEGRRVKPGRAVAQIASSASARSHHYFSSQNIVY